MLKEIKICEELLKNYKEKMNKIKRIKYKTKNKYKRKTKRNVSRKNDNC